MGVLDDIKAISAFNLVEVEVEAELGKKSTYFQQKKRLNQRMSTKHTLNTAYHTLNFVYHTYLLDLMML